MLFLRPVELARELLIRAGRVCRPGREDVRRLRILQLFESGALAGDLRYFNAEQLRSGQGYVDAFARTIADLEASGLHAELVTAISERIAAVDQRSADRLHDVAVTWQAADADRGISASTAQLLTEAADVVARRPELLAGFGPIFAVLAASPSAALLRFLRALPACRMVLQEARPQRTGTQRWRQLIAGSQRITPAAADAQAEQSPAWLGVGRGAALPLRAAGSAHRPAASAVRAVQTEPSTWRSTRASRMRSRRRRPG